MTSRRILVAIAYFIPTFAIALVWHMWLLASRYDALEIYRDDLLVPLGFLTMLFQAAIFAGALEHFPRRGGVLSDGLRFAALAGILSWTYTTLAVAAKFPMTSITEYVVIESAFTLVQWGVVGPLMMWVQSGGAGAASSDSS